MANTYTWSIPEKGLVVQNAYGLTNVVVSVNYVVTATDGTHTTKTNSVMRVPYLSGSPFTDFNNLTEAQVIGWVQASLGNAGIANIQKTLDNQIERMINPPPRSTPVNPPWMEK